MADRTQTAPQEVSSGAIQILRQVADFAGSNGIAAENGGRLPTLKEFITELKSPEFYEKAKYNSYWLGENGLGFSGYARIDYEKGTITQVREKDWERLPISERAYAYSGSGPVSLGVDVDDGDWRLGVYAFDGPDDVASRVALVRDGHVAAAPKSALETLQAELSGLEKTQREKAEKAATLEAEAAKLKAEASALDKEIAKRKQAAQLLRNA